MRRYKRIILQTLGVFMGLLIVTVLFISPITKYLVEKYDWKYTGRQIKMNWAYVNPLTGYVHFSNFRIYESNSDSIFFSSEGLSANINLLKLWVKTYEIENLSLNQPWGMIIQTKTAFNFNDIIKKFSPKKVSNGEAPLQLNVLNVSIREGEFHYIEKTTPINYFIKNVNFESSGLRWDVDSTDAKISLEPGIGAGNINGNMQLNLKTLKFHFAAVINKFDLGILQQYMKALANYGSFSANLDAKLNVRGNFRNQLDMTAKGMLAINELHLGENKKEDFASFDRFMLVIKEVSPLKRVYTYDTVLLNRPYFKYEKYDYLDNLQNMFGENGQNYTALKADSTKFNLIIEIAKYVKKLSTNFFKSHYKIHKLSVNNGDIKYNDYSISEKFSMDLKPLNIRADSIDKNHPRINIHLTSGIKPFGNAIVGLRINPKDSSDFELNYNFQGLALAQFNPYIATYTSHVLDRGTLEFNGNWRVRNGEIQSNNHLIMIDPRVGKRLKNRNIARVPLPFIMAFVREKGNVIDYEIPISGNLKDPKFHWRDLVMDLLNNLIAKPISIPYRVNVKTTESIIEKSLSIKWEMLNSHLQQNQEVFIKKLAEFLLATPSARIVVTPQHYTIKEKEHVLYFEAKKKYYLFIHQKTERSFTTSDSNSVVKMSVRDSCFIAHMNNQGNTHRYLTIQEKCAAYTNPAKIKAKLARINRERAKAFMEIFIAQKVEKQIILTVAKDVIPYNGCSFYKLDYMGKYPPNLIAAYREMNGLNRHAPRKAYLKKRNRLKTR